MTRSVHLTRDVKLEDVSIHVIGPDYVRLERNVKCWTTKQCVSAQLVAIQVCQSASKTEDAQETKLVSTCNARTPVKERSVLAILHALLKIIKQYANFVHQDLKLMPIMVVFKVKKE